MPLRTTGGTRRCLEDSELADHSASAYRMQLAGRYFTAAQIILARPRPITTTRARIPPLRRKVDMKSSRATRCAHRDHHLHVQCTSGTSSAYTAMLATRGADSKRQAYWRKECTHFPGRVQNCVQCLGPLHRAHRIGVPRLTFMAGRRDGEFNSEGEDVEGEKEYEVILPENIYGLWMRVVSLSQTQRSERSSEGRERKLSTKWVMEVVRT
ncbi:hypothetical protein DFH08DRAFT_278553 [Mycena albidolilacea]|uniref:Uncharacterized protein n=1 Tax=Mycena albidolilacea TaxID=1033008 RepID=A0AAD7AQI1_9AGAR|nr:hypothetical protein DFH08DRAFT_278553 [Mycena albidolilacea]